MTRCSARENNNHARPGIDGPRIMVAQKTHDQGNPPAIDGTFAAPIGFGKKMSFPAPEVDLDLHLSIPVLLSYVPHVSKPERRERCHLSRRANWLSTVTHAAASLSRPSWQAPPSPRLPNALPPGTAYHEKPPQSVELIMRPTSGPALSVDARPAFIFQCGESDLWAITLDGSGAILPKDRCAQEWVLRSKFPLGVHEPVPAPIDPEPIIRAIDSDGYFLWQLHSRQPHATSQ
jgi:hypothetical protein